MDTITPEDFAKARKALIEANIPTEHLVLYDGRLMPLEEFYAQAPTEPQEKLI